MQAQPVTEFSTEDVCLTVVERIAELEDTDPLSLPPLYSSIDPDALGALFESDDTGHVEFSYLGYEIHAHADGSLDVTDSAAGA